MRDRLPESAREEVASQPRVVAPAPSLARILALQRSAGNHAVGRMLARAISKEQETTWKEAGGEKAEQLALAADRYRTNFLFGPYEDWDDKRNFDDYKQDVDTPAQLLALIDKDIAKATAWKARQANAPDNVAKLKQDVASRKDEAKAKAEQAEKLRAEHLLTGPKKKEHTETVVDLATVEAAPVGNEWEAGRPDSLQETDASAAMPAALAAPPMTRTFKPSDWTSKVNTWYASAAHDHDGRDASELTLAEVRRIVMMLMAAYDQKKTAYVRRGAGSNAWSGTTQLKVIHRTKKAPGSPKNATYHFTLSPDVYAQLKVPEVGAEWVG